MLIELGMLLIFTGCFGGKDEGGWRKAIRYALTENPIIETEKKD